MIVDLTNEQQMIQLMVREFARKEIAPIADELDKTCRFPEESIKKMAELGLMGMMIPEKYGGSGVGAVSYSLAIQEIAYACPSTAVIMSVNNLSCEPIHIFGNEEQKKQYLTELASGQSLGAFAITEPEAGSDVSGIKTSADKIPISPTFLKGEYKEDYKQNFVINGSKIFITNGKHAKYIICVVNTDKSAGRLGLSAFIIEKNKHKYLVGKEEEKMGMRGSETVELIFDNCEVDEKNLIGKEGDGFDIAMTALDGGRIGIASQSIGIARCCLDESISYSKNRKQFGKYISSFQGLQWMIADMVVDIEAATLLTLNAASLKDKGEKFTKEASIAKLFSSEMANRVAFKALQTFGGYGYIKGYKIERLYRDARVTTIYEGTSEIQRIVIAKNVLK